MNPSPGISIWSGFHRKALEERRTHLKLVFPHLFDQHKQEGLGHGAKTSKTDSTPWSGLDPMRANYMIENCIGTMGLPVGLALNFNINSCSRIIPMVIEEPSVVAAVSGAAKTICTQGSGFKAELGCERTIMISQVQLLDIPDQCLDNAKTMLISRKSDILELANSFCPNMVRRGGGVVDVQVRVVEKSKSTISAMNDSLKLLSSLSMDARHSYNHWLVVHFHIDVCDAMGANIASTVAEGTAEFMASIIQARVGLRIVSNLCPLRLVKASFEIPVNRMSYKNLSGDALAYRIIEAYHWASDDIYRTTTHNKGIMNGIDAVAVAVGQDWRAIESAAHVWAASFDKDTTSIDGVHYKPLTKYWVDKKLDSEEIVFRGQIELPIAVGTKGGVLKTNPVYSSNLSLMGDPTAKELAMVSNNLEAFILQILASVGLAQNFAALRALVSEGIQRGHMSLHASNIAIAAGAPPHAINECVAFMLETKRISLVAAKEYVVAHALHEDIVKIMENQGPADGQRLPPSMFYYAESRPHEQSQINGKYDQEEPISLNIAFKTLCSQPVNVELVSDAAGSESQQKLDYQLLGEKTHSWITSTFVLLDKVKLNSLKPERKNVVLAKKLKLLSILLNILIRRLMAFHPDITRKCILKLLGMETLGEPLESVVASDRQSNPHLPYSSSHPGLLFQHNLYDELDLSTLAGDPDILNVGLPLMVAIWQVFELRVNQWVGHMSLGFELLQEHRRVIYSLISYHPNHLDLGPAEVLGRIMALNSKRFQVTLLLLCDAVCYDPQTISNKTLTFLRELGSFLEIEQTLAHDLSPSRLARDIRVASGQTSNTYKLKAQMSRNGGLDYGDTVNSFLLYLHLQLGWPISSICEKVEQSINPSPAQSKDTLKVDSPSPLALSLSTFSQDVIKHVHSIFKDEIKAFLGEYHSKSSMIPSTHMASNSMTWMDLAAIQPQEIFDMSKFMNTTKMYRAYYEVTQLFHDDS